MSILAFLAAASAFLFIVLIISLHYIRLELDPSTIMISQYARGSKGWIMKLAFFSFAFSCTTLAVHLWQLTNNYVGSLLLIICGIGTVGAGIFVTDTSNSKQLSKDGFLHLISTSFVVPTFPLVAVYFYFDVPTWSFWLVSLSFLGFILSYLATIKYRGYSNIPTGYFQRLMVISYAIWLIVAAIILK